MPNSVRATTSARPGEPVRTCIGCRERVPASELFRMVVAPTSSGTHAVHVLDKRRDAGRNGGGRGAWLHPRLGCFDLAERRHAFARALKVTTALDLDEVRRFVKGPAGA